MRTEHTIVIWSCIRIKGNVVKAVPHEGYALLHLLGIHTPPPPPYSHYTHTLTQIIYIYIYGSYSFYVEVVQVFTIYKNQVEMSLTNFRNCFA